MALTAHGARDDRVRDLANEHVLERVLRVARRAGSTGSRRTKSRASRTPERLVDVVDLADAPRALRARTSSRSTAADSSAPRASGGMASIRAAIASRTVTGSSPPVPAARPREAASSSRKSGLPPADSTSRARSTGRVAGRLDELGGQLLGVARGATVRAGSSSARRGRCPTLGCESSSSGRAAATSSTGESRRCCARYSSSAISLALGPVDVLEHEHGRLLEPDALDEASRREEQQQDLRDARRRVPARAAAPGSGAVSAASSCGSSCSTARASFSRATSGLSDSRIPLAVVDKSRERLVAGLLLVGQTAAAQRPAAVGGDDGRRSRGTAATSRCPAGRRRVIRCGRRSIEGAVPERAHQLELSRHGRRARLDRTGRSRGSEQRLDRQPRRDGLGLPLGIDGLEVFVANCVPRRAICLCSDDQSARSGAADCSREAVLTTSPIASAPPSVPLSSETTASPVFTAARAARSSPCSWFSSSIPPARAAPRARRVRRRRRVRPARRTPP